PYFTPGTTPRSSARWRPGGSSRMAHEDDLGGGYLRVTELVRDLAGGEPGFVEDGGYSTEEGVTERRGWPIRCTRRCAGCETTFGVGVVVPWQATDRTGPVRTTSASHSFRVRKGL